MGQDTIADIGLEPYINKHLFCPLPQGLGSQEYMATFYLSSNPLLWSPSHCYLDFPSELSSLFWETPLASCSSQPSSPFPPPPPTPERTGI